MKFTEGKWTILFGHAYCIFILLPSRIEKDRSCIPNRVQPHRMVAPCKDSVVDPVNQTKNRKEEIDDDIVSLADADDAASLDEGLAIQFYGRTR